MGLEKVNLEYVKDAEVCFRYGDTDTLHHLSDEELESIKTIFNGKIMFKENLIVDLASPAYEQ